MKDKMVLLWGLFAFFLMPCPVPSLARSVDSAVVIKKYHPGHYIVLNREASLENDLWNDNPNIRGFQKRYAWRDLEPEKGVYDFSRIESDLSVCEKQDKYLILFLEDKSFSPDDHCMPIYLSHLVYPGNRGRSPLRWVDEYVERIKLLCDTLASTFDFRTHFEGITFQESALGFPAEVHATFPAAYRYDVRKYTEALIAYVGHSADVFKKSQTIWFANFLPRDPRSVNLKRACDVLSNKRVVLAGPDILPYRTALTRPGGIYELQKSYYGRTHLGNSAQADSYRHHRNDTDLSVSEPLHRSGYVSMEEIFLYGRDVLRIDYMFWAYVYLNKKIRHNTFYDALTVIDKYSEFGVDGSGN